MSNGLSAAENHTEDPVTNKSIDKEVELRSKGRVYSVYISTGGGYVQGVAEKS